MTEEDFPCCPLRDFLGNPLCPFGVRDSEKARPAAGQQYRPASSRQQLARAFEQEPDKVRKRFARNRFPAKTSRPVRWPRGNVEFYARPQSLSILGSRSIRPNCVPGRRLWLTRENRGKGEPGSALQEIRQGEISDRRGPFPRPRRRRERTGRQPPTRPPIPASSSVQIGTEQTISREQADSRIGRTAAQAASYRNALFKRDAQAPWRGRLLLDQLDRAVKQVFSARRLLRAR